MKDYIINGNTLAIVPLSKKKCVIYEDHNYYIINERASKVMDENCKFNGSTINGRIEGTKAMTGISYKAPIIINETNDTIFFPTSSPRLQDCSWINVNNIINIYPKEEKCLIEFQNKELIEVNTSYHIIKNQYFKSLSLEKALKNRKNN